MDTELPAKLEVCSFNRSWDKNSFGVGLRTPNLGEGEAVGDGTVRKSGCDFLDGQTDEINLITALKLLPPDVRY